MNSKSNKDDHHAKSQAENHGEAGNHNPYSPPVPEPPESEHRSFWAIFQLRSAGYPWKKAIVAAWSMGVPLLVGAILGNLSLGLLAAMGGLASAYTSNEPYVQRALRLILIVLGLSLSIGIGILTGGSIWLTTLAIAGVSTLAFFLCETWQVPKPSGFLFTLVCAVGTGLPIPASGALLGSALVALGGAWAWILSMSGFLINRRGPEISAVENAYLEVAGFLFAVGSPEADYKERNATVALRAAQAAIQAAEIRRTPRTGKTARLRQLTYQANALFLAGIELSAEANGKLTPGLPETVHELARTIANPARADSLQIPKPVKDSVARRRVYDALTEAASVAAMETYETKQKITLKKQSIRDMFMSAFNRESLVVPMSLRIGITLAAATLIAAAFGTDRPYWVPLTCAAVLNGSTPVTIVHRSIQRAVGTAVGIFIGTALITLQSSPFIIVFAIMLLQFCIQFAMVRNYGFGVTFVTPLALLMAESGRSGVAARALIETRLLDTVTGCVIGLIGGLLLWRRASSARLPAVLGDLIRLEEEILQVMLTAAQDKKDLGKQRRDLETALVNVRSVYDNGTGELKKQRKALESYWPAVVAAQRLGYLLLAGSKYYSASVYLKSEESRQLNAVMQELTSAAKSMRMPDKVDLPEIKAYPSINQELHALYDGLQAGGLSRLK